MELSFSSRPCGSPLWREAERKERDRRAAELRERVHALRDKHSPIKKPKPRPIVLESPPAPRPEFVAPIIVEETSRNSRRIFSGSVMAAVSYHFMIGEADMCGKMRIRNHIEARHIAMYLLHKLSFLNWCQIGRKLGGMDHTSAIHGFRKIEALIARKDPATIQSIAAVEKLLGVSP